MRFLRRRCPGLVDRRGLLIADIAAAPGLSLQCGVAHFPLEGPLRLRHARAILDLLEEWQEPSILVGDFNEEPGAPALTLLQEAGLRNLSGEAATFTSGRPRKKLDFVFGRGQLRPVGEAQVVATPASDHLPVVVELEVG
jgi:endonuclease/exonuclease/phosphatase family metal-dependent hydrolase